jgi:hypothetical protein
VSGVLAPESPLDLSSSFGGPVDVVLDRFELK